MLWSKPMLSCTVFPGLLSLHISTLCTPPSSYLSLPWCTYMYVPLLVLRDPEREQVSVPGSVRNDPAGEPRRLSSRNASGRERTPPPGARGTACICVALAVPGISPRSSACWARSRKKPAGTVSATGLECLRLTRQQEETCLGRTAPS